MRIDLDLLRFKDRLRVRQDKDGKRFLFDPIRKKWLVLQPEEMVRQLMAAYLIEERGFSPNHISMERGLKVNTLDRRFDLLVYDQKVQPFLLIECKAFQVELGQSAFEQVVWYNSTLRVPYLAVTNGIDTYCCWMDYEQGASRFVDAVPGQG